MRPHRLRVTAFGAFAGTEQVVFDDLDGLFLLHGETGAGKTTLLDAIAFALYGRVPGERGTARRLRSDHAAAATATEVELEATVGGRRLRITRRPDQHRPRKSGHGTTAVPASVRLEERSATGAWDVKSTRIGEADKEIGDLLGMSAEQFFQVVLLPQGEFARFLRADAKDKEALLQRLFGTDRFRRVEDWLADRRRAADKDVAAAGDTVTLLLAQLAQAAGTEVPGSLPAPAAWAAARQATAEADRAAAAAQVTLRQADLEASLAAQARAEQLADRQRRRQDALGRQREIQAAVPGIEHLGPGPAALRAAGQQQQTQVGRLESLRAVIVEAETEDGAAARARDRAVALADDLDQLETQARHRQDTRPQAEQVRDAASAAATALPAAQAAADDARRVARDSAALVVQHARRGQLNEAHQTAREQSNAAQEEALRIRRARIDGMRAELAAQMTDGSPCPVCGSLDHPEPVDAESFPPVSRDEEDAAFQRATVAAQTADQAGQEVAGADATLRELAQRLAAAGFRLPPAAAGGVTLPAADALPLAAAAQTSAATADELEAESLQLNAVAATLTARQHELDQLDRAIAGDQTRLAELTEQRTAALAEAAAAAARAAARRADLAAQLGDGEDLESALAAAVSLAEALLSAAALAEQLADPDLAVDLEPPAPVAPATAATAAAQRALEEASTEFGTARHRAEQLARLVPRLTAALAELAPRQERAAQVRHLADLANGTSSANQYKMTLSSFVLAARLEEVAAAASERLLTMTAGRYSLVHSDARRGNAKAGLSLLACDAWTGADRDTATLSGGETFLASLALALGLADAVTAESAGTPMEALFVDEGFGTLDEETLDEVMNVLDDLRAGGRIVGIVSHVAELRSRVPAQIQVRKTRTGSHVHLSAA